MKKGTYLGSRIVRYVICKGLVNEFEVFRLIGEEDALKSGGVEVVVNDGEFLVSICLEIEKFVVEGRNIGLIGLKWM